MEFKKIKAPSVDVEQIQVTQSVTVNSPTLAPFIFGVCREVVNALDDTTGNWNSASKYLSYTQLPQNISYLSFPSPRANIDQVTVEDSYVRVFHDFASQVNELSKTSNFLVGWNKATQPIIRTDVVPADGWDLNPNGGATTLVLVKDQTVSALTNQDIAVTFTSTANAKLTNDEALVFFDFLSRFSEDKELKIKDQAEERILWDLTCALEAKLVEPLQDDYDKKLEDARTKVRDVED
jgi:hypothetical protein